MLLFKLTSKSEVSSCGRRKNHEQKYNRINSEAISGDNYDDEVTPIGPLSSQTARQGGFSVLLCRFCLYSNNEYDIIIPFKDKVGIALEEINKTQRRVKLSVPAQVDNMKKRGIRFEIVNEANAKRFLENNTYYFKLKAYEKDFEQYRKGDKQGQYVHLDFAYLQDLSTIDSRLRKILLQMCVDIEHFLKVYMLRDFNKTDEDGYDIIEEFDRRNPDVIREIINKKNGSTCSELISKYGNDFAIWNIVEVLSFRQTITLFTLYCERQLKNVKLENALFSVRKLRNAAAHNNCLINNLQKTEDFKYNRDVVQFIRDNISEIGDGKITRWMKHPVVHDYIVLLHTYCQIVPQPTKGKALQELKEFYEGRMLKHKEYYLKNQVIQSAYEFTKKIIDKLTEECI